MKSTFNTSWIVFCQEIKLYFHLPITYIYLVTFVSLAGLLAFTSGSFFEIGEASLSYSFFRWHPWLHAFLTPAIGMRIWTLEKGQGTLELLSSQPVQLWTIALGKYLAAALLVFISLSLTFPAVVTIEYLGEPDYGEVISGYLGSALIGISFLAISNYFSAAMNSPVSVYILACASCITLVLLGSSHIQHEIVNSFPRSKEIVDAISTLSITNYFMGFRRGLIELQSLIYFACIIVFSLMATCHILERHKD